MEQVLEKCSTLDSRGPLKTLIFTTIIDSLLTSANTGFNTYRILVISHSNAWFQLGAKYAKRDNVSYLAI